MPEPGPEAITVLCKSIEETVDFLRFGVAQAVEFVDDDLEALRRELGAYSAEDLAAALEGHLHDTIAAVVGDLLELQTRLQPAKHC